MNDVLSLTNREIFVDDQDGHGYLAFDVVISIGETGENYTTAQFEVTVMGINSDFSSNSAAIATTSSDPVFTFYGLWGGVGESDVTITVGPSQSYPDAIRVYWDIGYGAAGTLTETRSVGDYTVAKVYIDLGSMDAGTPPTDVDIIVDAVSTKLSTDSNVTSEWEAGLDIEIFGEPATLNMGNATFTFDFAAAVTPPELDAVLINGAAADTYQATAPLPPSVDVTWQFDKRVTSPDTQATEGGDVITIDGVKYSASWTKTIDLSGSLPSNSWSQMVQIDQFELVEDEYGNMLAMGPTVPSDMQVTLSGDTLAPEFLGAFVDGQPAGSVEFNANTFPDSTKVEWRFSEMVTSPHDGAVPVGPESLTSESVTYSKNWEATVDLSGETAANEWNLDVTAVTVEDQAGNATATSAADMSVVLSGDTLAPEGDAYIGGEIYFSPTNGVDYDNPPSVIARNNLDLISRVPDGEALWVQVGTSPAIQVPFYDSSTMDVNPVVHLGQFVDGQEVLVKSWYQDDSGNKGDVSAQNFVIDMSGPQLLTFERLDEAAYTALPWSTAPAAGSFDDGDGEALDFEGWYRFDFSEDIGFSNEWFSDNDIEITGLTQLEVEVFSASDMAVVGGSTVESSFIVQVLGNGTPTQDPVSGLKSPVVDPHVLYGQAFTGVVEEDLPTGASTIVVEGSSYGKLQFQTIDGADGTGRTLDVDLQSLATGDYMAGGASYVDWSTNTLYVASMNSPTWSDVGVASVYGTAVGATIFDVAGNAYSWDAGISETLVVDILDKPFGTTFAPEGPKGFDTIVLNGFDGRLTVNADERLAAFQETQGASAQDFYLDDFNGYVFEYSGVDWYGAVGSEKVVVGKAPRTPDGDDGSLFRTGDNELVNNIFYAQSSSDDPLEIDTISYQQFDDTLGIKVTLQDIGDGAQDVPDVLVYTNNGNNTVRDAISGFRGVVGSQDADDITGDSQANYLGGMGGGDTLRGGAGTDILVGGTGADFLYGGEGQDILIDFDGSTLQGRATTVTSDKDIFIVRRDSVIQNFELSPSGTRLAGRSGDHADALVLSVAVDRILNADVLNQQDGLALAVQEVKDDGGSQDEMETAASQWLMKEGALSFKFLRSDHDLSPEYVVNDGDLGVVMLYNSEFGNQVGLGFVTIEGLADQLDATIPEGGTSEDGDTVTAVRIQHFDPKALLDANFDPEVTEMAMNTIFEDSALLIPIALEQVRAGTLGIEQANERGVMAGDMGLAQRIYNPGQGDQTMIGGIRGKDIFEVLTQNFTDENGNPVSDAGRDRVFDYGGEDLLRIADVDMTSVNFEAVMTGKGATSNSLRISFDQSLDGTQNQGDITWAGHFANRGKQFLEMVELGGDEYAMGQLGFVYDKGAYTGKLIQTATDGQNTIMVGRSGEVDQFAVQLNTNTDADTNDVWIWGKGAEDTVKVMDGETEVVGAYSEGDSSFTYTAGTDEVVIHFINSTYDELFPL